MEIAYPESFKNLLNSFSSNDVDNYVGQCNPNAKILIIAKEIGMTTDDYKVRYNVEIRENFKRWCDNERCNYRITNVPDWFDDSIVFEEKYNALAPYYGELFLHKKGNNKGTNPTYFAYQKLINSLLPDDQKANQGSKLNFYNYCFITELSTNCKPMSGNKPDEATEKSINKRLINENGILRHPFFQQFPIIILACYRYVDLYNIPILSCFGTDEFRYEYKGIIKGQEYYNAFSKELKEKMPLYESNNNLKKNEFINVHISDNKKHPHLLLHTNHFCERSNGWIEVVAEECKKIIEEHNIQL